MKDEHSVTGDTSEKKKRGRPKGSKNQRCPAVDVTPSRCPKCGSTNRAPYSGSPRIVAHAGVHEGKPFTQVVFRRTRRRTTRMTGRRGTVTNPTIPETPESLKDRRSGPSAS